MFNPPSMPLGRLSPLDSDGRFGDCSSKTTRFDSDPPDSASSSESRLSPIVSGAVGIELGLLLLLLPLDGADVGGPPG
jgi:hypothetical protein